jgi:NAD(P)-dependent dehydrogenase (short-subunit alcohol dehydrogenase family)
MSTVFVTGSADGLGLMAAEKLVVDGNRVIGHARNAARADQLRRTLPGLAAVVTGDAASFDEMRAMVPAVLAAGPVDAIIHNVGVGYREARRIETIDGHAHVLQINVLTPYLLTALIPAQHLIWLSSGLHRQGDASTMDMDWRCRSWDGFQAYCDSKLFDATLAMALARHRPDLASNALEPGWVATRMGGPGAPEDLALAHLTQVWLAEAATPAAAGSGAYYFHQRPIAAHPAIHRPDFQDELLERCARLTAEVGGDTSGPVEHSA